MSTLSLCREKRCGLFFYQQEEKVNWVSSLAPGLQQPREPRWLVGKQFQVYPPLCFPGRGSGLGTSAAPPRSRTALFMSSVSALALIPGPPASVSVTPLFVPVLVLVVTPHVPVRIVMVCAAPVAPSVSGGGSASVAASVRGLAPQAPSRGRVSLPGLAVAPLQAGGAQGVEEEALVGAPQGTL